VRLEPLYRVTFSTPESWSVRLDGENGSEGQSFPIAEGRSTGRLSARYRAANLPRRRTDGTLTPDFRGVLETDDGAGTLIEWSGLARSGANGVNELVGRLTHVTDDSRYAWLNDRQCAVAGEGRPKIYGEGFDVVIEVAELSVGATRPDRRGLSRIDARPTARHPSRLSETVTRLPSSARCGSSTPTRPSRLPR
jgi:hypothetical protein